MFLAIAGASIVYLATADEPKWWGWPLLAVFLALGLAEIAAIIRPPKIVLDEEGIRREGWLLASRSKIKWCDVDCFLVATMPAPHGSTSKYVALKWREGSRHHGRLAMAGKRLFGADAYIPMAWPSPHERIVEELNEYRLRALERPQSALGV